MAIFKYFHKVTDIDIHYKHMLILEAILNNSFPLEEDLVFWLLKICVRNLFPNLNALIFQFQFCANLYTFLEESLNTIHSGYVYHCYDFDIIKTDLNEGNSSFEIKLA
jgi:hypothetical protein